MFKLGGLQPFLVQFSEATLFAKLKHLDNILDDEILSLNIPTGTPLVYELDKDLKPVRSYYLGNQDEINAKIKSVASQGKS